MPSIAGVPSSCLPRRPRCIRSPRRRGSSFGFVSCLFFSEIFSDRVFPERSNEKQCSYCFYRRQPLQALLGGVTRKIHMRCCSAVLRCCDCIICRAKIRTPCKRQLDMRRRRWNFSHTTEMLGAFLLGFCFFCFFCCCCVFFFFFGFEIFEVFVFFFLGDRPTSFFLGSVGAVRCRSRQRTTPILQCLLSATTLSRVLSLHARASQFWRNLSLGDLCVV